MPKAPTTKPTDFEVLAAQFVATENLLLKRHTPKISPPGGFKDLVWEHFDAATVLTFLAEDPETSKGVTEAFGAAFLAWIANPVDKALRQDAIMVAVKRIMAAEEVTIASSVPTAGLAADWLGRYVNLGLYFLKEIYYPIGGMARVSESLSETELLRKFRSGQRDVRRVLDISYIHRRLVDRGVSPSLRRAEIIYRAVNNNEANAKETEKVTSYRAAWPSRFPTAAIINAADSLEGEHGKPLLDQLLQSSRLTETHQKMLPELFGRAVFFLRESTWTLIQPGVALATRCQKSNLFPTTILSIARPTSIPMM